jgi:hypothetical protein
VGDVAVANSALAGRWFEEVWNQRREATVTELLGDDGIGHLNFRRRESAPRSAV